MLSKRGQVWIETVIYTLIALSLIAIVLSYVNPKINEAKDKATVDQTINSLVQIDSKINDASQALGNRRIVEFLMERGTIEIDPLREVINFTLRDMEKPYSEVGKEIDFGSSLNIVTMKAEKSYSVSLWMDYSGRGIDIKYNGLEDKTTFTPASIPYKFAIENAGPSSSILNAVVMNITEVSG